MYTLGSTLPIKSRKRPDTGSLFSATGGRTNAVQTSLVAGDVRAAAVAPLNGTNNIGGPGDNRGRRTT